MLAANANDPAYHTYVYSQSHYSQLVMPTSPEQNSLHLHDKKLIDGMVVLH
jgi:hypothetical protein